MNISDFLITMSQNADIEQPTLFPFPFRYHIAFVCIALIFFAYRFIRDKQPYQAILAVAIPLSLVISVSENKTLFYIIGIVELILLIAAFVTSIVFKKKKTVAEPEAAAESAAEEAAGNTDGGEE